VIDPAALPDLLIAHLPRQRWAGAGERTVTDVSLRWWELVRDESPALLWTVADATYDDGTEVAYQVFIGARTLTEDSEFLAGKDRELLGTVGDVVLYDALIDPDLAIEVLHLVDPGREVEVRRPIVLEHSNSSIVFDEALILKLFRRVVDGPNPDVEITRVLAEHGVGHVLAPLAELHRDGTDLGVLRDYLIGSFDGWQLAQTSIRDLLASRLPPEECGADFAPDAERLGVIVAELHVGMAAAWGASAADPAAWSQQMLDDLDHVASQATRPLPFDAEVLADRFRSVARAAAAGSDIRIHGDLHLAQVIRADAGWFVLDFEGEPVRRRDDRFTVSSPLRDVAGMLRSLHYVAHAGLAEWDEGDSELSALVTAWEQRSRTAFLTGYLSVEGVEDLLPPDDASRDLVLSAFELDKAVYEVGYELAHRPEWVGIPTTAIERVLAT
jgi:maltokinase